jgi:formylmethanofuran dehydrogenase subunit C
MPTVLRLVHPTTLPIEVDGIVPATVRAASLDELRRRAILVGNRETPLGELFTVSRSGDDGDLVWEGDCSVVKRIAAGMKEGRVRVPGSAGMHVAAGMIGGEVVVDGDADDWLGAEMRGGRVTVRGNAGRLVGAAYRGSRRGMTGGEIFVHGSAGHEIGHTMRRGLIAVGGRSGDAAGFHMIAGSIFLFGPTGHRHGAGMKRGTIGLFSDPPHELLPTFRRAVRYAPAFMRVYLRRLLSIGFPIPPELVDAEYDRWCGDLVSLGKGEILIAAKS